MSDQPTLTSVPSDLDPTSPDALDFRPEPHALAPGASAQAAEQAGIPGSGPNVQAGCASEGGEPVTLDVPQPPTTDSRADGRDPFGRFAKGTSIGLATRRYGSEPTHGVRRFQRAGVITHDLAAQQAEDIAGFVADLGGLENLTTAKRAIVEKAAEALTVSRLFAEDIGTRGAFTAHGRVRATTTGYLATVDRIVRLLGLLGLERKARNLDTLDGYVASRYGNRASGPQDTREATDDANVAGEAERSPAADVVRAPGESDQ